MNRREFLEDGHRGRGIAGVRLARERPRTNGALRCSTCTSIFVRNRRATSHISTAQG